MLNDLTGRRFGRLRVIGRAGTWVSPDGDNTTPTWHCICDCGNEVIVIGRNMKAGRTKSCGCLRRERSNASKA